MIDSLEIEKLTPSFLIMNIYKIELVRIRLLNYETKNMSM